jgi:hypothetical protein
VRPDILIFLYEYSGITGALAFRDTVDAILAKGELSQGRREMAFEEGRKAAELTKRGH